MTNKENPDITTLVRQLALRVGQLYAAPPQDIDARLDAESSERFDDARIGSILAKFEARASSHKLVITRGADSGDAGRSHRSYAETESAAWTTVADSWVGRFFVKRGVKGRKGVQPLRLSSIAQCPSDADIDARLDAIETTPFDSQRLDRILRKCEDHAATAKQKRRSRTSIAILSRCAAAVLIIATFASIVSSAEFFKPMFSNVLSYLSGTRNSRELKEHRVPEPTPREDGDAASGNEQMVQTPKADVPERKLRGDGRSASDDNRIVEKHEGPAAPGNTGHGDESGGSLAKRSPGSSDRLLGVYTEPNRVLLSDSGGPPDKTRARFVIRGVKVMEVVRHSAADRYGVKKGDVILSINGEKVSSHYDVRRIVTSSDGLLTIRLWSRSKEGYKTIEVPV